MIEIPYVLGGIALLAVGSKANDDSPAWIINIWGLVVILRGIGFFQEFIPNYSLAPAAMIASMVFFKGSKGAIQPVFFLSGILLFIYPVLNRYGELALTPEVILFILLGLVLLAIKLNAFKVTAQPTVRKLQAVASLPVQEPLAVIRGIKSEEAVDSG